MPDSIRRPSCDDAVTAVVGTVLVLAITVAGIGVALFMGTPVIQRLQDEAAVDTVVGSFEAVRHASSALTVVNTSRSTPLPLPAGVVSFGLGSHFLISVDSPTCALTIAGWSDWGTADANRLTITTSGSACLPGTAGYVGVYPTGCGTVAALCIEAFDLTAIYPQVPLPYFLNGTYDGGTGELLLAAPLQPNHDILIRVRSATGALLTESWLIHSDRLSWSRESSAGLSAVHLEAGLLLAREHEALYRVAGPRIDEGDGSALALSLPTFQNSSFAGSLSEGDRGVYQLLHARALRTATTSAARVQIDIHGDLAQAWCNTLLQRNSLVPLTAGAFAESIAHPCTTGTPSDGIRGVTFSRVTATPFPFQFGQPILHARLQV